MKAVGSYITDVMAFLDTLHNKYSEWIMKSTTTGICAINSKGTLTGVISEVIAGRLSIQIIINIFFSES